MNQPMNMDEIYQELLENAIKKNADFSAKLTPGCKPVLGVKVPYLRKMAKKIAKEDYQYFMKNCPTYYLEQEMLMAFTIGYAKDDIETILEYATDFVPNIHDWMVNDGFCQNFSIARKNRERVYDWLLHTINAEDEYRQRVVAVMLMSHFLVEEYIDEVLAVMNTLQADGYYRQMGVAWCVATAYAKYPKETYAFLLDNRLDDWTYNKAIQKMIESYRVSDEDKQMLRGMKRKIINK